MTIKPSKYKVSTHPTAEPIDLTEAKLYLRVDTTADDDLIETLIKAARESVELYTSRALVTQTVTQKLDYFPSFGFRLAVHPVQSITSIVYKDSNGADQTLSTDIYMLDNYDLPNAVVLKSNQQFPATYLEDNCVTVTYVAGETVQNVPAAIKQAIYLTLTDFYENRTNYVKRLPTAAEYLLNQYRVFVF
jgi:uncharacterized phiE125 gp8 family phage protein